MSPEERASFLKEAAETARRVFEEADLSEQIANQWAEAEDERQKIKAKKQE